MKRLIVNADDLGMTEGVNRGILDAHRKGIVTSTSLLANGGAFHSAVAASRATPRLSVGVHLNLSEGAPVSPAAAIPGLVSARGVLYLHPARLLWAIAVRRVRLAEIETELRAQVERVIGAGIAPSHLDGHMHVHALPGVAEIVVKIAREFGIPAVRCPAEPAGRALRRLPRPDRADAAAPPRSQRFTSLAVSAFARRLRGLLDRAGLGHPARFYGIVETGILDARLLDAILRSLPQDSATSELLCHPGYGEPDLAHVGGMLQARERETEVSALTSPEVGALIAAEDIRLVSYRELRESNSQETS